VHSGSATAAVAFAASAPAMAVALAVGVAVVSVVFGGRPQPASRQYSSLSPGPHQFPANTQCAKSEHIRTPTVPSTAATALRKLEMYIWRERRAGKAARG
jgi:hypothetical protein